MRRVGSERAHGTVLERRGDLVDVQHGLPVFIVQSPDDDGVGFAFHRSDHVGVALVSPRKRNVVVGLLDASDDFIVHLLRQRLRVREVRLGVRVLSLEVRDDRRIFPVVVAEPEEVVVALDGGSMGFAPRFSPSTTPKRTLCGTRLAWEGWGARADASVSGRRWAPTAS